MIPGLGARPKSTPQGPGAATRGFGAATRAYRQLIKLYPSAFLKDYEGEMIQIFEEEGCRAWSEGSAARWHFGFHLALDLVRSAPREWAAAFNTLGNKELLPMKIHFPSRRQDLLVGSLVSTVLLCGAAWMGHPARLSAAHPLPDAGPKWTEFPVEPDPPLDDPVVDPAKAATPQDPAPPQQQDYPQADTIDGFTQPIEPPAPHVEFTGAIHIPETRGQPGQNVQVFNPATLDQQPVARFQARPQYPYQMRQQGQMGSVLVDFIVDSSGTVRNASAIRSSNREFEASALTAVSKWLFKPGRKDGRAVYTHMQVPVDFMLDDK